MRISGMRRAADLTIRRAAAMTDDQMDFFGAGDWPEKPRRAPRTTAPALDAEQLSFDWALPVSLGPEDYFVSESNADAHAMIAGGLRWPEGKLALVEVPMPYAKSLETAALPSLDDAILAIREALDAVARRA